MEKDFYWEYMQETDKIVDKFISTANMTHPVIFHVGAVSMKKAVANYLWERLFFGKRRDLYNDHRISGKDGDIFFKKSWEDIITYLLPDNKFLPVEIKDPAFETRKYFNTLKEYRGCIIFFCKNHRQLLYFKPLIESMRERVLVLAKYDVPDGCQFKENIQVIEFNSFVEEVYINNDYLKTHFPLLFEMANTYTLLLGVLKPKSMILLEGCHFETEVISAICKTNLIPTICLQQGWPSLMHTRFKNMTYNYFLTWGDKFNCLWRPYNSFPDFISTGYLYKVKAGKVKKGITFFLQAPLFILNENYLKMQVEFAIFCATSFNNRNIFIREHPEYKMSENEKKELCQYSNIIMVSGMPLVELFSLTEIGVSVFSSTLMEGMIHETIPFIFNPTSFPQYYPDLDKKHLGIETKSLIEAKDKMIQLINSPDSRELILKNIRSENPKYFTASSEEAIDNTINFITSVSKN